jgi:hypothetical protein
MTRSGWAGGLERAISGSVSRFRPAPMLPMAEAQGGTVL